MHQALYRKWRPKKFDDVCGQDPVVSVLQYEVLHNKTSHAYLFCGSRGTGKTTCAKILAKAVNCEHPENGNPCGKCASCLAIDSGASTDVVEMDAASNTGVDYIREIREEVAYSPSMSKFRIYIIDEVHMLSISAFNALLKTLEEPPANVIFILATTELQKVPVTVVSRCQRFDFRRISVPVIAERLRHIASEEGIEVTDGALSLIARLAQGGMRDAISMLDLCSGETNGSPITEESVTSAVGVVGREGVVEAVDAVLSRDYAAVFAIIEKLYLSSLDIPTFFGDLLSFYRDMLVSKVMEDYRSYLDLTEAEAEEVARLASRFTPERLIAQIKSIENAIFQLQKPNAMRRVIAETELLRLCDRHLDSSAEGILSRLAELEARFSSSGCAEETPPPLPRKKEAPSPSPASTVKEAVLPTPEESDRPVRTDPVPFEAWADVAGLFAERDVQTGPLLAECTAQIDRATGSITVYAPGFVKKMIDKPFIREQVAALVGSVTGTPVSPEKITFEEQTSSPQEISLIDEL